MVRRPDRADGPATFPQGWGARCVVGRGGIGVGTRAVAGADAMDATILLTGPVTVYEVGTIRETLRTGLAERSDVQIDLSDSGPWDVAGLQLLVSCVKSGQERGQSVQVVNAPRSCVEVAERAGLSEWLRAATG
jgi:ABC-type transporter Mla MlaB component